MTGDRGARPEDGGGDTRPRCASRPAVFVSLRIFFYPREKCGRLPMRGGRRDSLGRGEEDADTVLRRDQPATNSLRLVAATEGQLLGFAGCATAQVSGDGRVGARTPVVYSLSVVLLFEHETRAAVCNGRRAGCIPRGGGGEERGESIRVGLIWGAIASRDALICASPL